MPHPLRDASSTGRWNLFPKPSFTINKRLSSVQSRSTLSRTLVGESIARTGSIRSQPRKEQTLTSFAAVHHNGPANNSVLSPFKTDNRRRQINHTVNVAEKSLFRICRTRLDAELSRASLTCATAALQYWDRSSSPAEMPIEKSQPAPYPPSAESSRGPFGQPEKSRRSRASCIAYDSGFLRKSAQIRVARNQNTQ
jgi:hypothetical protein